MVIKFLLQFLLQWCVTILISEAVTYFINMLDIAY
jgi:hypothetical protein